MISFVSRSDFYSHSVAWWGLFVCLSVFSQVWTAGGFGVSAHYNSEKLLKCLADTERERAVLPIRDKIRIVHLSTQTETLHPICYFFPLLWTLLMKI